MTVLVVFFCLVLIIFAGFSFRYAWWAPIVSYQYPRILMYHMIREHIPGAKFNGLRVKPAEFERQLAWLKAKGWSFASVSEVVQATGSFSGGALSGSLPKKTVVITFDDGFEDNYSTAYPLLRKYGAKATLYLVNQREGNDWSSKKKDHHNNGELMREPKLSSSQVQEMLDSGIFELGAHTLSHANLSSLTKTEKEREVCQSKTDLEHFFKVPVTSFAYPFGIFSPEDCEVVAQAGFTSAVTTDRGIDNLADPLRLKRLKISGKESFYAFKMRISRGRRGLNK